MYHKRADLNEIENYRFFLDCVYKTIQNYSSLTFNKHDEYLRSNENLHVSPEKVQFFYFEGRDVFRVIPAGVDFYQFRTHISYRYIYNPRPPNYPRFKSRTPMSDFRWYRSRYPSRYDMVDFRQGCGFVKNYSEVKQKEETNDKAWREYKQINRDKSKSGNRYRYEKVKKWCKTISNKSYRRHEKALIQGEQWDQLHSKKRKDFFDPWDWD